MTRYVALLRGINVGGNNVIRMVDLKACFEGMGLQEVGTYIQSGNVVFESPETDRASLTGRIEKALTRTFDYSSRVVVRSQAEIAEVVARAPRGFGRVEGYRYNVVFLKAPATAARAMESVQARDGVDKVREGPGVLYFSTLISQAGRSYLSRLIGTPIYKSMTIRNWNTTVKLKELTTGA